ncbi:PAS domain-containing protein [Piscinibacter sakaiensis]|uniref:PAS domain-containing protein n=1 Tax=Piscinibacter sakaiensis TaxID=1547922 RepID=UPI003AAF5BE9
MSTGSDLDQAIVEQMAEALIYSNRDGTIERWNAAAASIFGFSADETIGQNLDLIIPEHLRKAHWRGFEAAMSSGKTRLNGRATMTRGLHKSGQKLYLEMSFGMVVGADGGAIGSVAVARDVTERVEREKAAAAGAAKPAA